MGQAKLKKALGLEAAKARIVAGTVKVLAMDYAIDNGAPTVKLDFEDPAIQPIDFKMNPITALRLIDTLDAPYEDIWKFGACADLVPSPPERQATACGPMDDLEVHVDGRVGAPTLKIRFMSDAPIAAIEFALPPPLVVALMHGILHAAQQFNWLETLQALKQHKSKLH